MEVRLAGEDEQRSKDEVKAAQPAAVLVAEGRGELREQVSEAELARRREARLSPEHEANLARWGYPYVADQFRFHLTLTSALPAETLAATAAALAPQVAPLCRDPLPVREIAIFGDPGGGAPFRLLRRVPLGG